MNPSLSALAAWWQRFTCRMAEARRLQRDMHQLARMSAHELRDIGFVYPALALAAAADAPTCCR